MPTSETDVLLETNEQKMFDDYVHTLDKIYQVESDNKDITFDLHHFQHPSKNENLPIILFIHGFGEHSGAFHEFIYRVHKNFISTTNLECDFMAYDQRSHGKKHAKADRILSLNLGENAKDVCAVAEFIQNKNEFAGRKLFLLGNSMGGATVLYAALKNTVRFSDLKLTGVILENPLILAHPNQANWFLKLIVKILGYFFPTWLVPAEIDTTNITHDKKIAKRIVEDPYFQYKCNFGTAKFIIEFNNWTYKNLNLWPESVPFCLNISSDDKIVNPVAGEKLFKINGDKHKSNILNKYQGAFHGLKSETDEFCVRFAENIQKFISGF